MKLFTTILSIIAAILVIFNFSKINFDSPFDAESYTALITTILGICTLMLLAIIKVVRKIDTIVKKKS